MQPLESEDQARDAEAGVGADEDLAVGEAGLDFADDPFEHWPREPGVVRVSGAQSKGDELSLVVEDEERMIDVVVVITVEEGELLVAVGLVGGGVNVEDDDVGVVGQARDILVLEEALNRDDGPRSDEVFES